MAEKSIIIIGAGIAGLAAGCYAQMNGYRSEIFELHDLPGGLCTAWERKGYIFDGCIHYLFGSAAGQPFNQVWRELGALVDRPIINHSEFMRVVDPDGRTLIVYPDPERLQEHLHSLAPGDARHSAALAQGVRDLIPFDMSLIQARPKALMSLSDWREFGLKMLPFMPALVKWGRVEAQDLAQRFDDPFLQKALPEMFAWPEIPVMAGLSMLAYMHTGNAGFPTGGSLEFARAIERRYLALGGQIHYKAQVEKILVENDRAVGVRLYDDRTARADVVISAADGRGTLFDWLDERYVERPVRRYYSGALPVHSQVQVSIGVARDLSAEPHWTTYLLPQPLLIAGQKHHTLGVKHYCFDPTLAPAGKSVVEVMLRSDYAYWQRIYGRKLYDTEQLQVADIVLTELERLYPGFRQAVEVVDVATPLSYERYTGNWQGATTGWLLTRDTMKLMISGLGKTLPGLDNFYLCGQWVEPGGSVPVVAMSGRNAIQLLCAADDRPFVTTTV